MTIREKYEQLEKEILSPYAVFSKESKGRKLWEEPCQIRTEFQRDRDRVIHSKAFRRLKHKTQVFITPDGDHYRTRLTHTLEVSQIARTIARALRLNEDLTEAIALAHDLGHTPFGHRGESALDELFFEGFSHNKHSLRVIELLEKEGKGLNLTWEVRDGVLYHSGEGRAATLEGRIIKYADRIAYLNHDIDDAVRGGVLKIEQIPKDILEALGFSHKNRINTLITDIIKESMSKDEISMSPFLEEQMMKLREFMFAVVYKSERALAQEEKAKFLIECLYRYFVKKPVALPKEFSCRIEEDGCERVVCDYIAGMTDYYAIEKFKEISIPTSWQIF